MFPRAFAIYYIRTNLLFFFSLTIRVYNTYGRGTCVRATYCDIISYTNRRRRRRRSRHLSLSRIRFFFAPIFYPVHIASTGLRDYNII
jgi:hypothetical protein